MRYTIKTKGENTMNTFEDERVLKPISPEERKRLLGGKSAKELAEEQRKRFLMEAGLWDEHVRKHGRNR